VVSLICFTLWAAAKAAGVIVPRPRWGGLRVVLLDPGADHDAGFEQAVELFAVEALDERVLLAALLDEGGLDAALRKPVAEVAAMNSCPLSERKTSGWPCLSKSISSSVITSRGHRSSDQRGQPSASRVYSSTTFRIRIGLPFRVRPPMKSYDQTWIGAGRFQIACSAVPCARLPESRLRLSGTPVALQPPEPLNPFAVHLPALAS
jgi:hypothetical protein